MEHWSSTILLHQSVLCCFLQFHPGVLYFLCLYKSIDILPCCLFRCVFQVEACLASVGRVQSNPTSFSSQSPTPRPRRGRSKQAKYKIVKQGDVWWPVFCPGCYSCHEGLLWNSRETRWLTGLWWSWVRQSPTEWITVITETITMTQIRKKRKAVKETQCYMASMLGI